MERKLTIREKHCKFWEDVKKISEKEEYLIILGASQWGKRIYNFCKNNNIKIDAIAVDDEYYVEDKCLDGIKVEKLSIILERWENINVIIGVGKNQRKHYDLYEKGNINKIVDYDLVDGCDEDFGIVDYSFIEKNMEQLKELFQSLCDEKSKVTMEAFLNQKISGKYGFADEVIEGKQYFPTDIITIEDCKNFVDCGAYDGDTYKMLREYEIQCCGKKKIIENIYLFEMDKYNYNKLERNILEDKRCKAFCKGVGQKKEELFYNCADTSTTLGMIGENKAYVDSLDHMLETQNISYIKMDIEGFELSALRGARKIIEEQRPVLAICVYHKKDDLLKIPQYIKELVPEYKLYLRWHEHMCTELVLYAKCEKAINEK